jgi:hypothetical protein
MITEIVNGELRQVVSLGEFRYHAPVKVGTGYRRRIEVAKANGAIDSGALALAMKAMSRQKKNPGISDEQWAEKLKNDAIELIAEGIDLKNVDNDLAVLEAMLIPFPGSPAVREAYMNEDCDKAVREFINFIEPPVSGRTETGPEHSSTGTVSAENVPVAASKRISRRHTVV